MNLTPHFYVKPAPSDSRVRRAAELGTAVPCARPRCGLPPVHPVHLQPTGPTEERAEATG